MVLRSKSFRLKSFQHGSCYNYKPKPIKDYVQLLEKAITNRNVLLLQYRSPASGIRSEREIEPWGIYFAQDKWMLVAFCRLRTEKREFRLDGVLSMENTDSSFPPHQFTFD